CLLIAHSRKNSSSEPHHAGTALADDYISSIDLKPNTAHRYAAR
ncbi:MAG: hypothetical protein ACI8WB_006071, partial [Phenylobacterium sp.]